jgi:3,4-dihydroxyphenylacetate 2,3-dioxygenase
MGRLALAAKITHVPSMYLSELDGPHKGCRAAAIEGHREIARRCLALGVDTIVVLDTHWMVNAGYHVNCGERFKGVYTSNELPHFIRDMAYDYPGDPALGRLIAAAGNARGIRTRAHEMASLGEAIAQSDATVAVFASGSLSHRFNDDGSPEDSIFRISREFYRQVDLRVVDLWRQGDFRTFTAMLPEYAQLCHGEGGMHDTVMLLGLLGWDRYDKPVEFLTEYFASSGTGQLNAIFPLP